MELRRLPVGDFLWVAREMDPPPGGRGFRWAELPAGGGGASKWAVFDIALCVGGATPLLVGLGW